MNIFNKVTLASLSKNKTRTAVTIIGIILSAAMICAVTTLISSLQDYLTRVMIYESGNWHGYVSGLDSEEESRLREDERVTAVYRQQNIGYALLEGGKNENKPYIFISGTDAAFNENMPVHLKEGRLPESSADILIPDHVIKNGGVNIKVGDIIELDIGERVLNGEEPELLSQRTSFMEDEVFNTYEKRTFTVCGIYERPSFEDYKAPGYTALTVIEDNDTAYGSDLYFKITNPKDTYNFLKQWDHSSGTNSDLLMVSGASSFNSFYTVLYSLASIFIVLIMFGSVSLIYNAFAISVSERTKYFGILSSVGARKRQIIKSVFFEAVFVSAIGIPIGVLCGIGGIGITLKFLGTKFSSVFLGTENIALNMKITVWSVVIAVIIAFLTVLISAWIPSRRAGKTNVIEAIRQSGDIKDKKSGKSKTSRFSYKLFGVEGMIAGKYFKRSRKKYRATVVSLFMSIVLFISASSFCTYLTDSVSGVKEDYDYDINYSVDTNEEIDPARIYKSLSEVDGVSASSRMTYSYYSAEIPAKNMNEQVYKYFRPEGTEPESKATVGVALYGVDEEIYNDYLESAGISADEFSGNKPLGIACSSLRTFDTETERYITVDLFNSDNFQINIERPDEEKLEKLYDSGVLDESTDSDLKEEMVRSCYDDVPLDIGFVTSDLVFGLNNRRDFGIIVMYPMEYMKSIASDGYSEEFYFKAENHKAVFNEMKTLLDNMGVLNTDRLYNRWEGSESDQNLLMIIKVFSYGFIVLISLIATANVFNTISTNIMLRRREFAMLKSIGMTSGGFNKMMNYECMLYGIKSLLYGIPVSFGVTWLIFKSIQAGMDIDFYLPWTAVAIAVFSVFAVVFATMLYSMSKIKKDNPIDALRNENL